ncbi:hypothetical protein D9M68_706520 [compost metagenome]
MRLDALRQLDAVGHVAREGDHDQQVARLQLEQLARRVRGAAGAGDRGHHAAMHFQPMLQQAGQKAAGAETRHVDALRAQDRRDRALARLRVDAAPRGLGIGGRILERGGEHFGHRGGPFQLAAQPLDRRQRGLEAAHQLGTELRIAVEPQRPRKAVGRGCRAEQIGQHVFRHAAVRRRQRRQAAGDAVGDRMALGHVGSGRDGVRMGDAIGYILKNE